jgi:hypothetical protein
MAAVAIVLVLIFALAFSFRDTIRGVGEFFDIRAVRRLLRQPWKAAVTIGAVLGLFVLLWLLVSGPDDSLFLFLALVPLIVVPGLALVWLILSDIWEAIHDSRKRTRRKRQHK